MEGNGGRSLLISTAVGWLLALVWMVALTPDIFSTLSASGNDDAMRLVEVRDLLQGQGWFDLTQHRLGPGDGTPMHWSRLVDAPIAGLILAATPLLGSIQAEAVAATLWPLLLILPLVLCVAAAARALGGRGADLAGSILAAALAFTSFKFAPGALDHHNVQLVLLAMTVAGLVLSRGRPRLAVLAGVGSAASLATGIEMLSQVAVVALAMACLWLAGGSTARSATQAFAGSLAVALAILFFAAAPAEAYGLAYCDAFTLPLALPFVVGAGGLWLSAATLSGRAARSRLLGLLALGALVALTAAMVSPACLRDPFAGIDPLLMEHWIARVNEARSIDAVLRDNLAAHLPGYAVPLIGLAVALAFAWRGPAAGRGRWLALAALIAVSFALACYQVRGRLALELASLVPLAALVALAWRRYRETRTLASGLAALALLLLAMPMVWSIVLQPLTARDETAAADGPKGVATCLSAESFAPLAALPPGLISASSNLGPHILRFTPHRVLAAPFHRNQAGLLAQLRIAMAPPAEAEALLRSTGVDYVVTCIDDPEYVDASGGRSAAFFFALQAGERFAFLEPVAAPADDPLRLYRLTER
jgi:hypothetical protein